jgi:DNA replication and repair protein RecF
MTISSIRLQNFRSYSDESFEFYPGVNIIVGPNASGKTNLLEAILVAGRGSSYRAKDSELVRFGQRWARLDVGTERGQHTLKLELSPEHNNISKTYIAGGKTYARLNLTRTIPAVVFEPEHLLLLSGGPEGRRLFIDDLLEQTTAGFGALRRQYKRALTQRNVLLKHGSAGHGQMFAWNIRLSELGGQLVAHRLELIERLNARLPELYSTIARQNTDVRLAYTGSCPAEHYGSHLLRKLEESETLDYQRGFTAYGPHRDDVVTYLENRRVQESASRGELRTLMLALKILELELVAEARAQTPVLLLDDVFSELDGKRRRALTDFLKPYQTFITTTDADVVVQHFMADCRIIPLGG